MNRAHHGTPIMSDELGHPMHKDWEQSGRIGCAYARVLWLWGHAEDIERDELVRLRSVVQDSHPRDRQSYLRKIDQMFRRVRSDNDDRCCPGCGAWEGEFCHDDCTWEHEPVADSCTLRVRAVNREIVESDEVAPGPGLSTLEVVDDLGRRVEVAGMALGPGFHLHSMWPLKTDNMPDVDDIADAIVSKAPLDAAKTYLVIVIEHPDEAQT